VRNLLNDSNRHLMAAGITSASAVLSCGLGKPLKFLAYRRTPLNLPRACDLTW